MEPLKNRSPLEGEQTKQGRQPAVEWWGDAMLSGLPARSGFAVALSGGVDSTVLLHTFVGLRDTGQLDAPLRALHINHQLQSAAKRFESHCRGLCEQWKVPLKVVPVKVADDSGGAGPEGEARTARYNAFLHELQADEILLQAHHQDDLMETLLLRLLRGAGPRGLAAIPPLRRLGKGWLARPLLQVDRSRILARAKDAGLDWIEDPSNADTTLDRNYCRQVVLPALAERWPNYRVSWQKSITLCTEASTLLEDLAEMDLQAAAEYGSEEQDAATSLPLAHLRTLSPARQRNALRLFLRRAGLPEPGWNPLQQLVENVIPAVSGPRAGHRPGAQVKFPLGQHTLLVHRTSLQILPQSNKALAEGGE